MKKLVLSLAILGFVTFGALSVQNLMASVSQVETVNFDKDPKKDDNKKTADTKEAKTETKSSSSCASACGDKSESAKSCCGSDKSSTSEAPSPDKK
jgi:hypothetical protein